MSAPENRASAVKKVKSTQLNKGNNRNSGIFVKSHNPKINGLIRQSAESYSDHP